MTTKKSQLKILLLSSFLLIVPFITNGATEFVSTLQETGGDFSALATWEAAIQCNLAATTTRVYSGSDTGTIAANASVTLADSGGTPYSPAITGTVVSMATTSNQILIDGIDGSAVAQATANDRWEVDDSNYWTVTGSGDELGDTAIAVAEIDGAWTAADTTAVFITGWTTSAANYIKVYTTATARHNGIYVGEAGAKANTYRLEITNNTGIKLLEEYSRADGLQIQVTVNVDLNYNGISIGTPSVSDVRVSNNIIKGVISGTVKPRAMSVDDGGKIWNNIMYDFPVGIYVANGTWYIYNNTIRDMSGAYGFRRNAGTTVAKNNLVTACAVNFNGAFNNASTNNASNDATYASSTADLTGQVFTFVASSTDDFHLASGDVGAKDLGVDLSGDGNLAFSDDIDDDTRTGTWDIGADEYVSAEAAPAGGVFDIIIFD